ncbi:MAG TPA: replication initiator, partial [Actinomycetes bacterium]|nr:replication initiator [Actinomycetes bacterium]
DAAPPADQPDRIAPPPAPFDVELLEYAIRTAAGRAKLLVPDPDDPTRPLLLRWGDQLDTRPITTSSTTTGPLSAEQVAGYIAKYATKSTEGLGLTLQRRLTDRAIAHLPHQGLRPHVVRLIQSTWSLGGHPRLASLKLRSWAHQLGFGGHWSTRSRRYSTTMTALRRARAEHARRARWPNRLPLDAWGRPETDQAVEVLATWSYAGSGWRTQLERQLAVAAAVRARDHRRHARANRATA